jgi:acyl carrier protein
MDRTEIKALVLSVISAVLKFEVSDGVTAENTFQWDSIKHIEVIFALEDELDLQFPEEMMPNLNSVERIVDAIEEFYAA